MTDGFTSTSEETVATSSLTYDDCLSVIEAWITSWLSTFWSTSLRINLKLSWRNGLVSWSLEEDSP